MGELHAHVAQSPQANNPDLLALGHAPVTHRGIRRDPRAQQRCDTREIQVVWDVEHELLVNNDAVGVSAVSDAPEMFVRKVIRENKVRAELFLAGLAFGTGAIGVDQAANGRKVAGLEHGDG